MSKKNGVFKNNFCFIGKNSVFKNNSGFIGGKSVFKNNINLTLKLSKTINGEFSC